ANPALGWRLHRPKTADLHRLACGSRPSRGLLASAAEAAYKGSGLIHKEKRKEHAMPSRLYLDDPGLGQLLTSIRKVTGGDILSPAESATLLQAMRAGDTRARERFITFYLPLVIQLAKRYARPGLDIATLIQGGTIGLMECLPKYDPERGPFANFA